MTLNRPRRLHRLKTQLNNGVWPRSRMLREQRPQKCTSPKTSEAWPLPPMSPLGVRRAKAALSSGCKSHQFTKASWQEDYLGTMILLTFTGTRQSDREAKNAIVSGSLPYYGLDDDESRVGLSLTTRDACRGRMRRRVIDKSTDFSCWHFSDLMLALADVCSSG